MLRACQSIAAVHQRRHLAREHALRLPLLGRAVSPAWVEVGRFLGPNIEEFHAREPDLQRLWRAAGIDQVRRRDMSFGAGLVMSGVRQSDGQRPA